MPFGSLKLGSLWKFFLSIFSVCLYDNDVPDFSGLETISQLIHFVDNLCSLGLKRSGNHHVVQHLVLSFFDVVSACNIITELSFLVSELENMQCFFEPTCAHARWALRCRLLSVRLSVCLSVRLSVRPGQILEKKSLEKNSYLRNRLT